MLASATDLARYLADNPGAAHERCAGLAFVERPFMGKSSAFVAFFNLDGGIMFKVFVGRDEARALKADQLAAFRALAERLCRG